MIADLAPYLISYLIALTAIYLTGLVVALPFKKQLYWVNPILRVFCRFVLGTVFVTMLFALIMSMGKTITIGFVLLGSFFLKEYKFDERLTVEQSEPSKLTIWDGILILLAILLPFAYKFNSIYVGGSFPFVAHSGNDYAYYSYVAQSLAITGLESWHVPEAYIRSEMNFLVPYHYFDLWLAAAVIKLTGLPALQVYETVALPIYLCISLLGLASLVKKPTLRLVYLPFFILALYAGHVHFVQFNNVSPYLSSAIYQVQHLGAPVMRFAKLAHLVPFVIAFGLLVLSKRYMLALVVALCVPLVYVSAVPAFVSGLSLTMLVLWLLSYISFNELVRAVIYIGVFTIFYFGFYKIFGGGISQVDFSDLQLFNSASLKTRVNIVGLTAIQVSIFYAPVLLLFGLGYFINRKTIGNEGKPLAVFLAIFFFVAAMGLGAWALLYQDKDGAQLFGNNIAILNVLYGITFVWGLSKLHQLDKNKLVFNYSLVGVIAILFAAKAVVMIGGQWKGKHERIKDYSVEYLISISNAFKGEQDLVGVFLKGDGEYLNNEYQHAHRASLAFKLSWYLSTMPQYFCTTNMSVFEIPETNDKLLKKRQTDAIKHTAFYKFVMQQQENQSFVNINKSKKDYLLQHKVRYLIVTPSAIVDTAILSMVEEEFKDIVSGERFFVLKTKQ